MPKLKMVSDFVKGLSKAHRADLVKIVEVRSHLYHWHNTGENDEGVGVYVDPVILRGIIETMLKELAEGK